LDQVLAKSVLNGDEVSLENLKEHEHIKKQLRDLYWKFYHSDELSPLEEAI
jgi:hypothetical protein